MHFNGRAVLLECFPATGSQATAGSCPIKVTPVSQLKIPEHLVLIHHQDKYVYNYETEKEFFFSTTVCYPILTEYYGSLNTVDLFTSLLGSKLS